MSETNSGNKKPSLRKLFLFSIIDSYFATVIIDIITSLFLVDIASTFQISVGNAGQLVTVTSISSVMTGLCIGILSIRYNFKSILLLGVLFIASSSIGTFLAPNFGWMLGFYSLNGIGSSMVFPMALAIIGDYLPIEKRAGAVGWVMATQSITYIIGAPILALISNFGWRFNLIILVLPISVVFFVLAAINIPTKKIFTK